METKSSNLSVLLEEGVKRGRVKMDFETEIRYDDAVICNFYSLRTSGLLHHFHFSLVVAKWPDLHFHFSLVVTRFAQ